MKSTHKLLAIALKSGISYECFLALTVSEIYEMIAYVNGKKEEKKAVDLNEFVAPTWEGVQLNDFY